MVGMDLEGGRYFFNAVREGDSILYASDDENECSLWVMAMYRATGQSLKPTPPLTHDKNSTISKIQGDADKARKHGMEDFISADPCTYDHATLFRILQNLTLDYRLNDPYASLVSTLRLLSRKRFIRGFVETNICSFLFRSRCAGLVQSRSGVRAGRVLRAVWCPWLLSSFVLFGRFT